MADLPFTLDQLRILKAIASEGSFKKAAESLYISQPAVSLQVQNLERQLSVPIFDRGNRKAHDKNLRPGKSHIAVTHAAPTPRKSVPIPTPIIKARELST